VEQFIAVAAAHFLALLIPGVDFLLIVRTTVVSGWRPAIGVCAGIAVANGLFITAAFCGTSLITEPLVLDAIRLAGGFFLGYIGLVFLRSHERIDVDSAARGGTAGRCGAGTRGAAGVPGGASVGGWRTLARTFGLGLASGLLNPKNALFYVSLATVLAGASPVALFGYGVWMFSIVAAWDVFVAIALGNRRALVRMNGMLPWLTRIAGLFLILFGLAMLGELVWGLVR
jgi:threonine/homoserine/homoserine lactone efflux protein